ncbi:MAG: hypothetical protein ACKO45_16160 [Cyanobium sp.]
MAAGTSGGGSPLRLLMTIGKPTGPWRSPDRMATQKEANLLADVGCALSVPAERLREIEASLALLACESDAQATT